MTHISRNDLSILGKHQRAAQSPAQRSSSHDRIVLAVIKTLRLHNWVAGKIKVKGSKIDGSFVKDPYLFIGVADVLAFHQGKIYFFEVKTGAGKQTTEQRRFQSLATLSGALYMIVSENNFDYFMKFVKNIK